MNVMLVNSQTNAGKSKENIDMIKQGEELLDILPEHFTKEDPAIETIIAWHLPENSKFVEIDRKQEDANVILFQKTKDRTIFEKLYQDRIPTLQFWARRHYYLTDSKENMFGELRYCFMKAVLKYQKNRGSFNTCLFTFILNYIRNLKTGKKAKKRKPEGADPESMNNFVLSLDYSYGNDDGEGMSLGDILSDKIEDRRSAADQIHLEETLDILSNRNGFVKKFLKALSAGNTLGNVLKASKIKRGSIKIKKNAFNLLKKKKKSKKIVTDLIKENMKTETQFSVVSYKIHAPNMLNYTIEMKKTKESDLILRAIRKLRRNKESILERISS